MEAGDERRLLNLQRQLSRLNLLIIDELGFVPLLRTGAELLFEVFSQRYERASMMATTNLPFDGGPRHSARNASPRPAGPAHLPCAHSGDERRGLPAQGQPGERRVPSSGRTRRSMGRTVGAASPCYLNVATLPDLLPAAIMSVVHDSAAPVHQFPGAIDAFEVGVRGRDIVSFVDIRIGQS